MATWIPPEQRDSRWWIWNKLFRCRVSNIQSMSVDYLKQFGMPTSGDARYDKETAHEQVIRMLSINQMVEYFRSGITVGVCDVKDTKEIYEIIVRHLEAWKQKLHFELNVRAAPVDDLVLLDDFASAVYKHARHHFTRQYVSSLLAQRMSTTLRVTRDRIMKPLEPQVLTINGVPAKEEEKKYPEHESMSDVFLGRKRVVSGGPKWK